MPRAADVLAIVAVVAVLVSPVEAQEEGTRAAIVVPVIVRVGGGDDARQISLWTVSGRLAVAARWTSSIHAGAPVPYSVVGVPYQSRPFDSVSVVSLIAGPALSGRSWTAWFAAGPARVAERQRGRSTYYEIGGTGVLDLGIFLGDSEPKFGLDFAGQFVWHPTRFVGLGVGWSSTVGAFTAKSTASLGVHVGVFGR